MSPEPLKIVIAGAGIGGLSAACFLRQQGHRVVILEKSQFANELGAAVHLAPNANGLLRRLGIFAEQFGANPLEFLSSYDPAGNLNHKMDARTMNQMWQHPWLLVHRVHLHKALKDMATAPEGKGVPVELQLSSKAVDFNSHAGVVTLDSGKSITGDVIIGADGVHSQSRQKIDPRMKIKSSGQNAFRFLIPKNVVADDPKTMKFVAENGNLCMWYGKDRRVVMYPCQNNEMLNLVCIHPTDASDQSEEGQEWNSQGNKGRLLKVYKSFGPDIHALLDKVDVETLKTWQLWDMDQLDSWVEGRLALLGDAAHPFTPHQGQGAGQAIEDAASLAVVLPLGTTAADVPQRLKLYESFRAKRAHTIQDYSRLAGESSTDNGQPKVDMMKFTNYNFGHDEWDHSTDLFRKWVWSRTPDLDWRMPISFGPMPGRRQLSSGSPRTASELSFSTTSFKFKTSRTLLQNLFPSTSFCFQGPGTVAYASFSQTTLNGVDRLGGLGYRHFGLYLHGVQYTQQDGEVVSGNYIPLLFESLSDPMVSRREELGMPTVFCSLDVWRRSKSYHLQAAWNGARFAELVLEGLQEDNSAASNGTGNGETGDGILLYKYIPKTGGSHDIECGQAEVQHAVFVPQVGESLVVEPKVTRRWTARKASVSFDALDWESLPTLHHVITRLAEIPVYDIVSAELVEGTGVPDIPPARKIV